MNDQNSLILLDQGGTREKIIDYYGDMEIYSLVSNKCFTCLDTRLFFKTEEEIDKKIQGHDFGWLVLVNNRHTGHFYKEMLEKKYKVLKTQKFYKVEVYYFDFR